MLRFAPTSAGQKGQQDRRDKRDTGQDQSAVGGWQRDTDTVAAFRVLRSESCVQSTAFRVPPLGGFFVG